MVFPEYSSFFGGMPKGCLSGLSSEPPSHKALILLRRLQMEIISISINGTFKAFEGYNI